MDNKFLGKFTEGQFLLWVVLFPFCAILQHFVRMYSGVFLKRRPQAGRKFINVLLPVEEEFRR